jgi:uncharacterized membrane protein
MFLTVTIIAALGCGMMAGVFFAFSAMVMPGLRRAEPAVGIAAMRAINVAVVNPAFVGTFVGTAVAGVVAAFGGDPWAWAGATLYVLGGIVLTGAFHIPRNDELERLATPEYWTRYLREWIPANHVRTLLSLAAAASFTLAALR